MAGSGLLWFQSMGGVWSVLCPTSQLTTSMQSDSKAMVKQVHYFAINLFIVSFLFVDCFDDVMVG